jgi:hypothetical protein
VESIRARGRQQKPDSISILDRLGVGKKSPVIPTHLSQSSQPTPDRNKRTHGLSPGPRSGAGQRDLVERQRRACCFPHNPRDLGHSRLPRRPSLNKCEGGAMACVNRCQIGIVNVRQPGARVDACVASSHSFGVSTPSLDPEKAGGGRQQQLYASRAGHPSSRDPCAGHTHTHTQTTRLRPETSTFPSVLRPASSVCLSVVVTTRDWVGVCVGSGRRAGGGGRCSKATDRARWGPLR